jgi:hypothetical protein
MNTEVYREPAVHQYAVYTQHPKFLDVARWLSSHQLKIEPHLNRTRFWITEGPILTEFLLRWADVCPRVEENNV